MLSQKARNHCIASLALTVFVTACSSQAPRATTVAVQPAMAKPVPASARRNMRRTQGEYAAAAALKQVGVPYRYGGSTSRGFDCSGLISYAYAIAGKAMPRTTSALWRDLQPVGVHQLRVGDVLFFDIEGKMSHVGLYIGDNRFVHAPSSGKSVTVARLDGSFYRRALIRGGRPR